MNADGSGQGNLTQHPASDSHPSWSPDGRKLAFVSRRDGNSEIYVMNADGSGLRNVTRTPSNDLDPAWSPDGRAIAFVQKIQKKCAPNPSGDSVPQLRDVPLCRERRRERAAATDNTAGASVQSKLVGGREDDPVRALSRAGRRQRADRAAEERRVRRSVVARREADRLRGGAPQPREPNRNRIRTLGRERRRKQPSAGGELRRRERSRVVPGRSPDRLQEIRRPDLRHGIQAFRPLCRERRRERAATAGARGTGALLAPGHPTGARSPSCTTGRCTS